MKIKGIGETKSNPQRTAQREGGQRMNDENLKPLGSGALSPEEELAIRQAGARASNEVQKQKRYAEKVKEEFQKLLNMPYSNGDIEDITSLSDVNKNTSVATKLYMKLILDYFKTGNPRLLELIMRYSGSNEQEITPGEQPEAEDNSLIAALNRQAEEVWKNEGQKE